MRRPLLPFLVAGLLPLGGCAYGLGDSYGGGAYGMGGPGFEAMAADACGAQAARYGRAQVTQVRQISRSTMRVHGTIDAGYGYQRRSFACSFRDDGRITDFDIN